MRSRDYHAEELFKEWLGMYKHLRPSFIEFRRQQEEAVSDTVTEALEPEKQEEESGPLFADENLNPDNPAEGTGPWSNEGEATDGAGVRPSPVQEAPGTDTGVA